MSSKSGRGALIGTGSIAPYHLTAWQHIAGVEVVALCDPSVAKAHALAERFKVDPARVYADFDELLARETGLDFVDIVAAAHQASYDAAQRHFVQCLRAGQLPETHAGDNLRTLQALFGAYQAAAENRVVPL